MPLSKTPARFRIFNAVSTATLATVLTVSMPSVANAQNGEEKILTGGTSANDNNANEVLPSLSYSADLSLPDGREITIHPDAGTAPGSVGSLFFHRPINAFITDSDSDHGHPIILDKDEHDGYVYIGIKLVSSTDQFIELARGAVIEEDPAVRAVESGIQERDIDARRWPLKLYRLEAKHALTGKEYGEVVDPKSLRSVGNQVPMTLRIPVSEFDEFLENLNADRIEFHPSYTFNNAIVAFGKSATSLSGEVSVTVSNALASQQIEEGGPIFQEDASQLENLIRQNVTTTIRANDRAILAHITPQDLSDKIITAQDVTFDSLDGDEALLDKVAEYLTPIIRKMQEEYEDERTVTDTTERTDDVTIKLAGSGKPTAIGKKLQTGLGFSGDLTLNKKQVKTLEDEHRVKFRQTENTDVIEPHSIGISTVRTGWQDNVLNVFQTIYLAVGRDISFQSDTPFRASFTLGVLEQAIGNSQIVVSPYSGVPRGVPMLSFRADIPKGWVALDGEALWPDENWVPEHLRGTNVPDMSGAFARGMQGKEQVGSLHNGQLITIPGAKINGSTFTMQPDGNGAVANRTGSLGRHSVSNDRNSWQNAKDVTIGGPTGFPGGQRQVPQTSFRNTKQFTGKITGSHTIPGQKLDLAKPKNQPPHIVGQWIMRIE